MNLNNIADAQAAALENLGTQAAAVNQRLLHAIDGEFFQVPAWLAQPDAAQQNRADAKGLAHQVIERHAAGHEVAARFARGQGDLIIAGQSFQGLRLDQGDFFVGMRLAFRQEIAIAQKTAASDRFDHVHGTQGVCFALREENASEFTVDHGGARVCQQSIHGLSYGNTRPRKPAGKRFRRAASDKVKRSQGDPAMPHILFLTGKLAEPALRRTLAELAPRAGFEYTVAVLPITVVALATTPWIVRHFAPAHGIDRVVLPGLCNGPMDILQQAWPGTPIERGPKDMRDLPDYFGGGAARPTDYGAYDIAILAEINHADQLPRQELLAAAGKAQGDGADLIDLGCTPGRRWGDIGDAVQWMREAGLRVSVDSFDPVEVASAAKAGAELILSVNSTNRAAAKDWGCEVVAVPDVPATMAGLDETVEFLSGAGVRFRVDPVLEPIAFGLAASLGRYLEVRRRYPQAEMLMGVGNLTELTEVDSAGINVLLLGFCQELGIRSVLTTEVINWSRSSVRELDLARRLVYHACKHQVLPKHLEPSLVLLRDPKLREHGQEALTDLARQVTDHNFRLFAEGGKLHVLNNHMHLQGEDPFALFEQMAARENIDPSHAFYLGYEMAKAVTALTLGKNYAQDQALRWGFLTREEKSHRGG